MPIRNAARFCTKIYRECARNRASIENGAQFRVQSGLDFRSSTKGQQLIEHTCYKT